MNLTALQTAFTERGWSRFTSAQQIQALNDANSELDACEPRWPYLLTTATGTLPLVTADLLEVSQIVNTSSNTQVDYVDYEDLSRWGGSLTQTSSDPEYWYFTPGSTTSITGYPVSSRTVRLVYWKVSPTLASGSDTPLSPPRWHHLIVDIADRNASRNKKDFASAEAIQVTIDRKLAAMRTDLLYRQTAGPSQVLLAGWDDF